jgi:CrcB protein
MVGSWPVGTLIANLLGCLALGVIMEVMELRDFVSREAGLAITVGFLGAFTTFSTFSHETVRLMERGEATIAVVYVAVSVFAGCALCYAGVRLSRAIWGG